MDKMREKVTEVKDNVRQERCRELVIMYENWPEDRCRSIQMRSSGTSVKEAYLRRRHYYPVSE